MNAQIGRQNEDCTRSKRGEQLDNKSGHGFGFKNLETVDFQVFEGKCLGFGQCFFQIIDQNNDRKQRKKGRQSEHIIDAHQPRNPTPDDGRNAESDAAAHAQNAHRFAPLSEWHDVRNVGGSGGRFEARRKSVEQAQQEKTRHRGQKWIQCAANDADQRAENHNGNPPNGVTQFAAEWTRDARCEGKKCQNVTFVIRPAKRSQIIGQLRNYHLKTGGKEEIARAKKPKRD